MPTSPRPRPRPSNTGRAATGRVISSRPDVDSDGRVDDAVVESGVRPSASFRSARPGAGSVLRPDGHGAPSRGSDPARGGARGAGRDGAGRESGENAPARYGTGRNDTSPSKGASSGRSGSGRSGDGDGRRRDPGSRRDSTGRDSTAGRNTRESRPQTAAAKRSAEVKARRNASEVGAPVQDARTENEQWRPEQWHDEGSVRDIAREATPRGRSSRFEGDSDEPAPVRERRLGDPTRLEPAWVQEVEREADARTSARYMERLAAATEALERERYGDALRMVQSVLKNLPTVGAGHEVAGIALYRLGEWRKAAAELEQARTLHPAAEQLPVLADCYRALRRYGEVDAIWREIRETSPAPAVMAEGRIVAAGALADQGDIAGALKLLIRVADAPKRVRDYHLKQWYVIADLYDRSGDVVKARNFFKRVAAVDPRYADVSDRLAMLGRR